MQNKQKTKQPDISFRRVGVNAGKISKEINNKSATGISLNSIGIIYGQLGEYDKALDFFNRSNIY